MTTQSKPRSVDSPGAPDRLDDPAKVERANPDGTTPADLPTTTPSVPTTPAARPAKK